MVDRREVHQTLMQASFVSRRRPAVNVPFYYPLGSFRNFNHAVVAEGSRVFQNRLILMFLSGLG